MMRNKISFILIAALILLLCFAGCGKGNTPVQPTEAPGVSDEPENALTEAPITESVPGETEQPDETAAPEQTEDAAATDDPESTENTEEGASLIEDGGEIVITVPSGQGSGGLGGNP